MTQVVVVGCALGSAMAAAASSVLQHRTARKTARRDTAGIRLLARLVAHPLWLLGLVIAGIGLGLHAVALSRGRLAVVQPLLVSGLLFALPASVVLEGRRPSVRDGVWATALVGALVVFLLTARPGGGTGRAHSDVLVLATAAGGAAMTLVAWCGSRLRRHRAALLATAAGIGYGVAAALLKQSTVIAGSSGLGAVLADWSLYLLIVVGAMAIALTQLAYRAGPLAESMPALTVVDPASAIFIGALAFHEELAHSPTAVVIELATFVVMGVASARLAREVRPSRPMPPHYD